MRMKSHLKKDLRSVKYRQRVKEDATKKVELKDMTHAELVRLMQENEDNLD